jgi:hypothetical protein
MSHFDELFGQPELTRRENWDGKEESLTITNEQLHTYMGEKARRKIIETIRQIRATGQKPSDFGAPVEYDTIDIDHEVVD